MIKNPKTNPNRLKTLKKSLDDADRAKKAALMNAVVDSTKALVAANPGLPFLVHRCDDADAQNKVVDAALKQVGGRKSDTQGTRKKYVFFAKQDPGRAMQNS